MIKNNMDPSSSSARMPTVFITTLYLQRNSYFINQLAKVPGVWNLKCVFFSGAIKLKSTTENVKCMIQQFFFAHGKLIVLIKAPVLTLEPIFLLSVYLSYLLL